MRPVSEHALPKYQSNSGEITPYSDKSIPGTNVSDDYSFLSSEESLDSAEEKLSTQPLTTSKTEKKLKQKTRSISFSIDDEVEASSPCQKGILKYSNRLRSLSESCSEHYNASWSNNGESNSALDELFEELEDPESESQKVKKTVRFSEKVHKQLFRSTSSILGQRKKNQRKQAKKVLKAHAHSLCKEDDMNTLNSDLATPNQDTPEQNLCAIGDTLESVSLSDSGIEAEDSDLGSTTNIARCLSLAENTSKKNKKQKRNKNNRHRTASESSNEMIFDLDI